MSEAYGKAMVADVVVTLSRKPEEKAKGTARLFVAKNRAGKDGILFPLHIDTSQSRFTIMPDSEITTLDEAIAMGNTNLKEKLKQKWKEVNEK